MVYLMWQWNSFKSICSNYCVSYILSNWEERWQETSSESERVGNAELASFEKAAAHLPSATCGEREQGQVGAEQNFGFSLYQSDRWQWSLKAFKATVKLWNIYWFQHDFDFQQWTNITPCMRWNKYQGHQKHVIKQHGQYWHLGALLNSRRSGKALKLVPAYWVLRYIKAPRR